jgi:hypothetical protein
VTFAINTAMAMKEGSISSSSIEIFVLLVKREVLLQSGANCHGKLKDSLHVENSVQ